MKYYTDKRDSGKSEINGKKINKDSLILETLGELDELNSLIGLAKNYFPKRYYSKLTEIQNNLFIIQAHSAFYLYPKFKPPKFSLQKIKDLEKEIKLIKEKINSQHKFIIPGTEKNSAWLDYLRAKTRTVERRLVKFNRRYKLSKEILSYINRLSSYFYALARFLVYNKNIKEKEPWY